MAENSMRLSLASTTATRQPEASGKASGVEELRQTFGRWTRAWGRLPQVAERFDTLHPNMTAGKTQRAVGDEGTSQPEGQHLQDHVAEEQPEHAQRPGPGAKAHVAEARMIGDIVEPARVETREGDRADRLQDEAEEEQHDEIGHQHTEKKMAVFL